MTTTTEQFRNDVEVALGGSLIDVELTEDDYNFALDKAKRIWQQRGNNNLQRRFVGFNVTPDTYEYVLPEAENIQDVVRIIRTQNIYSSADPFYSSWVQTFWGNFNEMGGKMAEYDQARQLLKQYEKYALYDTQFTWERRSNTLTLLNNPKLEEAWAVEVYANLTDEEYEDVFWVREYAIAEAKILLGSAYRKFQALSTPSGETSLAGDQMVQEGKDAQIILLEDIGNFVDGEPTGSIMIMG